MPSEQRKTIAAETGDVSSSSSSSSSSSPDTNGGCLNGWLSCWKQRTVPEKMLFSIIVVIFIGIEINN